MKSTVKNVWAAILAMLAALCLAVGGVLFVQTESRLSANNNRAEAAGSYEDFIFFSLKDDGTNTKADIWNGILSDTANRNKKLYVVLGEDWCLDGSGGLNASLKIPANFDITLDLNGKNLSRNLSAAQADGAVINVKPGGTFTLTDTAGSGKVTGGYNDSTDFGIGGGIEVEGTFTFISGTIENCRVSDAGGAGFGLSDNAVATMEGGVIQNCVATGSDGGGVAVYGTFTMNGGKISGNTALTGGGVYISHGIGGGSFIMNGGEISSNVSTKRDFGGSGVRANNSGTFIFNGGFIINNEARLFAGVYIGNGSSITMTGGLISGNFSSAASTDQSPAGLYLEPTASGTMSGGEISGHTCTLSNSVSGVYIDGTFTMTGGKIINNVGGQTGGMDVGRTAEVYLNGGIISGNVGTKIGGIELHSSSKLSIGGPMQITGNVGGNVYIPTTSYKLAVTAPLMANGLIANIGISLVNYTGITASTGRQITTGFVANNPNMNSIGIFMHADNSSYVVDAVSYGSRPNYEGAIKTVPSSSAAIYNYKFPWQMQLNDGTWYDTTNTAQLATMLGKLSNASFNTESSLLMYDFSPTAYVANVRLSFTHPSNGTTYTAEALDSSKPFYKYDDSFGNVSFPSDGAKNTGEYSFLIEYQNSAFQGYAPLNLEFNIVVNQRDIEVSIGNIPNVVFGKTNTELDDYLNDPNTPFWSVTSGTLESGDTLNLKLTKEWGTTARQYVVRGEVTSASGNYNIKIVNTGKLTIVPREVTIILNDDYATYGDSNMKESQVTDSAANNNNALAGNNVISQKENASTKYQDIEGKDVTSDGTTSGTPYYKGGWQYPSTAKAENKFVAATLTGGVSTGAADFLKYTFETLTSGTDYDANDTDKYLNVRSSSSGSTKAYYTVKVENTNKNYVVKFQDKTGTSIGTDDNGEFKFEVREADLGNLKAPSETSTPKVGKYTGAEYNGSAVTIALPDVALLDAIKGNKTQPAGASNYGPLATNADGTLSTGTYYKYWFADKTKIVADGATPDASKGEISLPEALKKIDGSYTPVAPETAASLMKDAADYVEANAVTPNTVTNKGTYVVYVLAKIPNHKAKVYKYEFKLDVAGIKYQIELWQSKKDGTGTKTKIEKNTSGAYEVDYDPTMKIEAKAVYEWQFTGATTTTPPAGWSPNAATSVPSESGATNTVTQAYVRMHYKGQSATIGTLGHDNAWGYGYPSTETGADQNALDNSGEKTVEKLKEKHYLLHSEIYKIYNAYIESFV